MELLEWWTKKHRHLIKTRDGDQQIKKQHKNANSINQTTLQMKDINGQVIILKSPLNLLLQQNMKVAVNTKRAWTKKIGSVKNVEGMKVIQMITLNVTSVPSGTINMENIWKLLKKVTCTSLPIATRQSLLTIYKSFIRPHLDYGDVVHDQPQNETGQYMKVVSIMQL